MQRKIVLFLILLIVGLVGGILFLQQRVDRLKLDRQRLKSNQETLLKRTEFFKVSDSLNAARVGHLELSKKELKEHNESITSLLSDMSIKLKNVQSLSTIGTKTEYVVKTIVKDSIVYREGMVDTLKCIDYKNRFLTISGCVNPDGEFAGMINSIDTIVPIVERIPKRFLFFRYGIKGVRLQVVSKNPYSKIICAEYLEMK